MKILQVHNRYLSGNGGEDVVLEADRQLLREHGHEVVQFFGSNKGFGDASRLGRFVMGSRAIWSRPAYARLREFIGGERPAIAHVHNTFADLSGSVYWALAHEGIPIIQTIHNYRWICPASTLLRDSKPCEECIGRPALPAILHRCDYNGSNLAAAAIAISNVVHFGIGTYQRKIHAVIALTQFMKEKLCEGGLDADRVHVRPNFLNESESLPVPFEHRDRQVVFVGLVDERKGVAMCAEAWDSSSHEGWLLRFIGDGKLRASLREQWQANVRMVWEGRLDRTASLAKIATSRFLILPSLWYEGLPMVLLEAMSLGTPLIVPDHGAFPEIVDDGVNGIVFRAGDVSSLHRAFERAATMQREEWNVLSRGALSRFSERYSASVAYSTLMNVYDAAASRAAE